MSNIDFLIVGSGLYGATMARLLWEAGYNCLILDQRPHIAGNIYSEQINGYDKHMYGPHIFHTSLKCVIDFVNKYSKWCEYQQNTLATDGEKLYHLPFNMNTFYDVFGCTKIEEAKEIIDKEIQEYKEQKQKEIKSGVTPIYNLEEWCMLSVGKTIYEKLIKPYTEKQWNKKCTELPQEIIKRLPLRFSFNNNYFNDTFQGIPEEGYTKFVENIIGNIPYLCDVKFEAQDYEYWSNQVKYNIIYCGAVDELLNYELGELEWRSLRFEDKIYKYNGYNGQGCAILNDVSTNPWTRTIEHMWFKQPLVDYESIITTEYPDDWERGKERYYPINNEKNNNKYQEYVELLEKRMPLIILGGRLGKYRYFDMDDTIYEAMEDANTIIKTDFRINHA